MTPSTQHYQESALLTPEQIISYHRDGFLVLDPFLSAEEVAEVRDPIMALFDRLGEIPGDRKLDLGVEKSHQGEQQSPQILGASRLEPKLLDTAFYRRIREVSVLLIGSDLEAHGDHSIFKAPHNGMATPWHQDQAYWAQGTLHHKVNSWLALQDVDVEGGCMHFIPHSHLGDLLPHRRVTEKAHALEVAVPLDTSSAVACPLSAGGVTLHNAKTFHYTGPNNTDNPRYVWTLGFGCRWPNPAEEVNAPPAASPE